MSLQTIASQGTSGWRGPIEIAWRDSVTMPSIPIHCRYMDGWFCFEINCTWKQISHSSPEQISVPSGWAKLGNVFHVHICPMHCLNRDRSLNLAAFMWLSPFLIISFSKNNIFVFFNDFQIIFKLKPSSMTVFNKYNCCNTNLYPFRLYVSISLKKKAQIVKNSYKNSSHFPTNGKYEQPLCT